MNSQNRETEEFCFYISGFVDGEGCFSVSFRKLEKLNIKIETRASFSIGQKQSPENFKLLSRIQKTFNGGGIRTDKGGYKYETRKLDHIRTEIIPFFKKYPLYTSKSADFDKFCKICSLIAAQQHLNKNGLLKIIDLAKDMNPSGTRRLELSKISDALEKIH